jgi:ABC-type Na+ efflux pump permease subunit
MSDGDQRQARGGPARRRSPWTVLAVGTCWCAVAIICSAALVPPDDEGGFYLIDHGRIEHYPSRLASVTPFIVIAAIACLLAAMLLFIPRVAAGVRTAGPALTAGFLLLVGGLIPLSVTLMAARPQSSWTPWLVLAPAALFVVTVVGLAARAVVRGARAGRQGKPEPR